MEIRLPGYRCRTCGREFMLRETINPDCPAGRHVLAYVLLTREVQLPGTPPDAEPGD